MPSAKYVVNIFEKNTSNIMVLIGTKSTDKNYARLDLNYLTTPNIYYSISAYNNGNGSLIGTGDVYPAPPGGLGETLCSKKCNGKTYAWELSYVTAPNNGPGNMSLNSAVENVDNATGVVTPFWQPISQFQYDLLVSNHPYKLQGTQGYVYKHKIIDANLISLMGNLFDKNNNPVYDGFLIEKAMDQYTYMGTSITSADPGINYCSSDVNAWVNFYNAYVDETTYSQPTNDYQFFAPTLPTQLHCNGSGSFTGNSGGTTVFDQWYEIIDNWFDCVWENYETDESNEYLDPCNTILYGSNGTFTGFEFEQIDNPSNSPAGRLVVSLNSDGSSNIISKTGQIKTGLYNLYVYTSTGKMLSSVYEIPEQLATKKSRGFVKLEIAPNKIENNLLKFKISSEKDVPVTITVHKLNGQLLHSETTSLSKLIDITREIALSNGSTPYNQIKVTLLFADGSSIQQTALKL